MLQVLASEHYRLLEHAVLCLGNIAGDKVEWRNYLLRMDADVYLIQLYYRVGKTSDLELVKRLAWVLNNLVRGTPAPQMNYICNILPIFSDLLKSTSNSLISKALLGLSNVMKGGGLACIELVINTGCIPKAVECVLCESRQVHLPAINLLGQISLGDFHHTELLFSLQILDKLSFTILSQDSEVRKQTFWVLSNLSADSAEQSHKIIESPIVFPALKGLLDADLEIRRECSYVFNNLICEASDDNVMKLVEAGLISTITTSLDDETDPRTVLNLLEAVEKVLSIGKPPEDSDRLNLLSEQFYALGITSIFEFLLSHDNDKVVDKVQTILDTYFESDDNEMDLIEVPQEFHFS